MKRHRHVIAALVVVCMILPAAPASARHLGAACADYEFPSGKVGRACSLVNTHDFIENYYQAVTVRRTAGGADIHQLGINWVKFMGVYGSDYDSTSNTYVIRSDPYNQVCTSCSFLESNTDFWNAASYYQATGRAYDYYWANGYGKVCTANSCWWRTKRSLNVTGWAQG